MISVENYNPCPQCPYRVKLFRCPWERKAQCPAMQMLQLISKSQEGFVNLIPDELFVEVLQKRGWKGELHKPEIVVI